VITCVFLDAMTRKARHGRDLTAAVRTSERLSSR
jgi:hypothetical protein